MGNIWVCDLDVLFTTRPFNCSAVSLKRYDKFSPGQQWKLRLIKRYRCDRYPIQRHFMTVHLCPQRDIARNLHFKARNDGAFCYYLLFRRGRKIGRVLCINQRDPTGIRQNIGASSFYIDANVKHPKVLGNRAVMMIVDNNNVMTWIYG